MNQDDANNEDPLPLSALERIHEICSSFEAALESRTRPHIESYLSRVPKQERTTLLRELLYSELYFRVLTGESPTPRDYFAVLPHDSTLIHEAFEQFRNQWSPEGPVGCGSGFSTEPFEINGAVAKGYSPGSDIGGYTVIREIGQGGFAVVYLADDNQLPRKVAIKVPRYEHLKYLTDLDQFFQEARAVTILDHPSIVPLYHVGRDNDVPYIVMKHIDGSSLEKTLKECELPIDHAIDIVIRMAEALHCAHEQGFVHRDIKPSNILIDQDGTPYLTDFGVALHETDQFCHAGEISGTWPYMSPEQVAGDSHLLDGRTDIWSLGVVFYRLIGGRLPFRGTTKEQLCEEIQRRDPKPFRMIDTNEPIAEELDRICMKCLSKEARDRYYAAGDLSRDLRQYLKLRRNKASLSPARVRCTIDLRVWNPNDESRRGSSLDDGCTLPLRPNDQVRIEVQLNHCEYLYVLWIDSDQTTWPVYPWLPGSWKERPDDEAPVQQLSLPPSADEGWVVEKGSSGMETIIVLLRETPLPEDIDLQRIFKKFPCPPRERATSLIRFPASSTPTANQKRVWRGLDWGKTRQIDDPVIRIERFLAEQVNHYFILTKGISFASGVM
jgi:serine/threonine protein kinase